MAVQQTLTDARGGGGGHGGRPYAGFGGVATTLQAAGGWRPGVGGIVQRPYNKDQGFCVFWDYLTGLPKRSGSKIIGKVGKATPRNDSLLCVGRTHIIVIEAWTPYKCLVRMTPIPCDVQFQKGGVGDKARGHPRSSRHR